MKSRLSIWVGSIGGEVSGQKSWEGLLVSVTKRPRVTDVKVRNALWRTVRLVGAMMLGAERCMEGLYS